MRVLKLGLGVFGVIVAAGVLMFGVLGIGTAGAAPGPGRGGQRLGDMEAALAAKLGISVDTLKAAQTAARNQLIDDAVGAGKLTPDQATRLKGGQPPAPAPQGTPGQGRGKGGKFANLGILHSIMKDYDTVLAQKLGVTPQQLQAAQTAARDQLIDAAVAAGKLTPDQATKLKSGQRPNFGGIGPRQGMSNGAVVQGVRDAEAAAASVLNMTPQDLQAQLRSGKSLAEIAQAKGIDRATLRSGIMGAIQTDVNNALKAGKITARQSTDIINRLSKGLDQLLDRKIGQRTPGARPKNSNRPGGQPQSGQPSTLVQPRGA